MFAAGVISLGLWYVWFSTHYRNGQRQSHPALTMYVDLDFLDSFMHTNITRLVTTVHEMVDTDHDAISALDELLFSPAYTHIPKHAKDSDDV